MGDRAIQEEKRRILDAYKRAVGCIDCGKRLGRLDFDHRDKTTKTMKVSLMLGYSWERIWAEVVKCDVRCAPCHASRHHIEEPGARAGRGIPKPRRGGGLGGGEVAEAAPASPSEVVSAS